MIVEQALASPGSANFLKGGLDDRHKYMQGENFHKIRELPVVPHCFPIGYYLGKSSSEHQIL